MSSTLTCCSGRSGDSGDTNEPPPIASRWSSQFSIKNTGRTTVKGTEPAARYRSTWYLLSKCGMPVFLSALQTELNTRCPTPAAAARSTMSSPCATSPA